MKNENDLRVLKTRKSIIDSFLSLLEKKSLEEISVTEICTLANCGRNTFYLHFPYKEALYDYVMDMFVAELCDCFEVINLLPGESYEAYSARYLHLIGYKFLAKRDKLHGIPARERTAIFFDKLTDSLREKLLSGAEQMNPGAMANDSYRLMCWYSAAAIIGFLKGCLYDADMPTEEELDILCKLHSAPFAMAMGYLNEK